MSLDMGTLARIGTALADPTRRRVLVHLIEGPGYPAEMAEQFGTTVIDELRPGYRWRGKLLRFAQVRVARP